MKLYAEKRRQIYRKGYCLALEPKHFVITDRQLLTIVNQRMAMLLAMDNNAMLLNRSPVSLSPLHDGIQ